MNYEASFNTGDIVSEVDQGKEHGNRNEGKERHLAYIDIRYLIASNLRIGVSLRERKRA